MTSQARFRYPLAALESLYTHRLEQARLALAQAQQRLDAHLEQLRMQRHALQRQYQDWASRTGAITAFDPTRHAVVREALGVLQQQLDMAGRQEQALRSAVDTCRERVLLAHRRSETLDRHKQDAARDFMLGAARADQRLSDDAWPLGNGNHDEP